MYWHGCHDAEAQDAQDEQNSDPAPSNNPRCAAAWASHSMHVLQALSELNCLPRRG